MEKVWTVYILECGDGTLYTGITDDLERRLKAHSEGKGAKYTRGRGPLIVRHREDLADKSIPMWYNFKEKKWEDKDFGASAGQMAADVISTFDCSLTGHGCQFFIDQFLFAAGHIAAQFI